MQFPYNLNCDISEAMVFIQYDLQAYLWDVVVCDDKHG